MGPQNVPHPQIDDGGDSYQRLEHGERSRTIGEFRETKTSLVPGAGMETTLLGR